MGWAQLVLMCVCHRNACFYKLLLRWQEHRWKLLPVSEEQKSHFSDTFTKFEDSAFISTCCLHAKLVAWYHCSNFVLIPLRDSKDRRKVHCNSAISASAAFLFAWPKMQCHSVLWKSFSANILHINLLAFKIQRQGRAKCQKFQQILCMEQ